jgi:hypothetical protein
MSTTDWGTWAIAIATFLLATATLFLACDSWRGRREQERQRKELAFRAALNELAGYIISFEQWEPKSNLRADIWWKYPLQFYKLIDLVGAVWIHSKLWERINGGVLLMIKVEEELLKDYMGREHPDQNFNAFTDTYYNLDLYLKQLIRYVYCEMQRQSLTVPKGLWEAKVFQPLAWSYGDLSRTPEQIAITFEIIPFLSLSREPDDSAFGKCRLATLIEQAREALKNRGEILKSALNASHL